MNPILLKPSSATGSQVIVHGKLWKTLPARGYYEHYDWLLSEVLGAFEDLASRFDFIVIEGAGSVAELNLRHADLVNFGLATRVNAPALLVGDIERGGIFASIIGSIALLAPEERALVRAFAVNKFRGDLSLFDDGRRILEERTGVPCLGVFPYAADIHVDDEDSLSVPPPTPISAHTRCAILRFPRISNTTDFRLLRDAAWITAPVDHPFDVIFLPGTKNTIDDFHWLRAQGFEPWLREQHERGARLVGICGGFQMLGKRILDPHGMESAHCEVEALGYFDMETELSKEKTVRRVAAKTPVGTAFSAYEIHLGESRWRSAPPACFAQLEGHGAEGAVSERLCGTYLHGATESASVLHELLGIAVEPTGQDDGFDALADWFEEYATSFVERFL